MLPDIPNFHAAIMLGLTPIALFLFTREKIPLETSSLVILAIILVFFELFPFEVNGAELESIGFFSGFGHEALIAVAALMICGQGLVATGALVPVGRSIAKLWRTRPALSLLLTLVAGAIGSAFVNNTPIVVLLIPVLANVAARNDTSASPWLMPMNFSTLLGGTCTTVGTSTNLLVVSVAFDLGLPRFGIFDFIVPGAIAGSIGMLYLWQIAPRLLSSRGNQDGKELQRDFVFQLTFTPDSQSIGKTVGDLYSVTDKQFEILRLRKRGHGSGTIGTAPLPDIEIEAGDRLTVMSPAEKLVEIGEILDARIGAERSTPQGEEDTELAQIVVMDNSPLVGQTIRQSHFPASYSIQVLAMHRPARQLRRLPDGIESIPIRAGDILLIQGETARIDEIKSVHSLLILDERTALSNSGRGFLAFSILVLVVLVAAAGLLPIATSAVCGALLMLLTRCIDWRDVGDALSIPVIMIVVVSLALGSALTQTGATEYIAEVFLAVSGGASPFIVMSSLILLMAVLTNVVSNNAAAVIGTPVAISIADQLGSNPETFVLAVLFGANLSFVTPMAYKTNVLVMNAGDYTFGDFVKVGLPLAVILWITYSLILPLYFGL